MHGLKKLLNIPASFYLSIITSLILIKDDVIITISSPDKDDDYIFALAIDNHVKAIVCGEKVLLNWDASPVEVISKKEFELLY